MTKTSETTSSSNNLRAVDAFSGAGGLSAGLISAGYEILTAIEMDRSVQSTYRRNHPRVHLIDADIRTVDSQKFQGIIPDMKIDLLVGCPPCQGFTSLTSKYRRNDIRNLLVREMSRLTSFLMPRAVMMENVPGLLNKGRRFYDELRHQLEKMGYMVQEGVLDVADFGVPQRRRRMVLLAGHGFTIPLPQPTHARDGEGGLRPWTTVRDTLEQIDRQPVELPDARKRGALAPDDWHVVRQMSIENKNRIKMTVAGKSREQLPENLRPECHQDGYRGFSNTYGRMEWDAPAPTITAGCTTFSKGRFGHPEEDRTISVREAALLQTFPIDYRFETQYMDHVCKMIGNALPPLFAEVLARQVKKALEENS